MHKGILTAALLSISVLPAQAAIVGVSGDGSIAGSAAGLDLSSGATSSAQIQGYNELTGITVVDGQITADYVVGTNFFLTTPVPGVSTFSSANGASLAAGTYDSHFLQLDSTGLTSDVNATFTFTGEIVAIILSNSGDAELLNLSDGVFGNAGTYETDLSRRVEDADGIELLSANTLSLIDWLVGGGATDELRVITTSTETAPVPLPAGLPLMLAAFGGLALVRKARKAA